jgi:N-acetylmuramoyl-L-alanine amidase
MRLIQHPSPNWNDRPAGTVIDAILLHATEDRHTENAIAWCCTPAPKNPKPVSYHNIVDRDATVIVLVEAEKRAWHAGKGRLGDVTDVNNIALGLSFANVNDGVEPYPDEQLAVGAALCAAWMKRFPAITMDRIVRHRDTALPAGRRTDPCPPAFDLDAFKLRVLREVTGGGGCI